MLDVVIVEVANTCSDFWSVNTTTEAQKLSSNIFVDLVVGFSSQETVPEMVTSTNYFYIIEIMWVDGWEANTAVVHLTSENFVTEEVVTEETTVTVGEVVWFSHGNVGQIS